MSESTSSILSGVAAVISAVVGAVSTWIAAKVYRESKEAGPDIKLNETEPLAVIRRTNAGNLSMADAKLFFMNQGSRTGALVDVEGGIVPQSSHGRISFTVDRSPFPIVIEPFTPYVHKSSFEIKCNANATLADIAKDFCNSFKVEVTYKVTAKTGIKKLPGKVEVRFEGF